MASHKFKIGEIVTIRPALSRNVSGGVYSFRTTAVSSNIASRA